MQRPRIGTAVWVRKGGKVLVGKRAIGAGKGTWCPPGGNLEMNERMIDCAIRETKEEAGVEIARVRLLASLENIWKEEGTHYVTLYFLADWKEGEPVSQDGEMTDWGWYAWDSLPQPLFRPAEIFVSAGFDPFT